MSQSTKPAGELKSLAMGAVDSMALSRPCTACVLFSLLFLITLFAPSQSEAQDLEKRISIDLDEIPLSQVLEKITEASGINFSYNPGELPLEKLISVKARNKPVKDILNAVLNPVHVEYQLIEGHIVLRPDRNGESTSTRGTRKQERRFTIHGFITDHASGEVLTGATVVVKGTPVGTVTNSYGFYSLTLPEKNYEIEYSFLGYRKIQRDVLLDREVELSLKMEENLLEINEVEVVSADQDQLVHNRQMSGITFSGNILNQLPGFGGNVDVIRALQSVPGIRSYGDGSSYYYVRGGNSDQNLLLIDEVPVYNPSHLFGFFSSFSPDAINSMQIYKGDFPARYGGRLSSVIDIKAREGNMNRTGISGNIGPFVSSLTLEGPIVRQKGSYIISGRVSTLNWLNNLDAIRQEFDFNFFDVNGKINHWINPRNRIFFTFYYGRDDFERISSGEISNYSLWWNNLAAILRWNHIFNSKLFLNTTASFSRYTYFLEQPQQVSGTWMSRISNFTLKSDASWYPHPNHTVRAGTEITYHYSNPGNIQIADNQSTPDVPKVSPYHSMEYVAYLSDEQQAGSRLSLRYGIRLPVWQDFGPASVYYFDDSYRIIDTISYEKAASYQVFFSPELRLNFRYSLNGWSSFKGSYSRMTQFIQVLSNSVSPFNSLEVWAPAGPNITPQVSDQVAAGYFAEPGKGRFTCSVEGYYKWFRNRIDYRDHANLLFNTLLEGEIRPGKGYAYGIEMMVRKSKGNLTGWVGYTWSRSMAVTPSINQGDPYPVSYDRPHNITLNLAWNDHKRFALSANWIYMTGNPWSSPTGFYFYNGVTIPLYGQRNNSRLPDYHRLDLSASVTLNKPGTRFRHNIALTIYNAYGRYNPFSVSFNKSANPDGTFTVPSDLTADIQRVPTSLSVAGVIPSINYQFRF